MGRESEIRQRAEELGRKTMHEVAAAREVFREGEEVDGVDG
ncbi:MAG: hypothetical protein R3E01_12945 [Pirellulaceae bacterium]